MNTRQVAISGHAEPGFEGVADAFTENFVSRGELGGACSMYGIRPPVVTSTTRSNTTIAAYNALTTPVPA